MEAKNPRLARSIMCPLVAVRSGDPGRKKDAKEGRKEIEIFAQGKIDLT